MRSVMSGSEKIASPKSSRLSNARRREIAAAANLVRERGPAPSPGSDVAMDGRVGEHDRTLVDAIEVASVVSLGEPARSWLRTDAREPPRSRTARPIDADRSGCPAESGTRRC